MSSAARDTTKRNYQSQQCYPLQVFEAVRWKINLLLVFQPLSCLARIDMCSYKWNPLRALHSATVGRLLFLGFLIALVVYGCQILVANSVTRVFRRRLEDEDGDEDALESSGAVADFIFLLSFLLAARFSVFSIFFGLSFENAVFYHKWVGRLAVFLGVCHGLLEGDGIFAFGEEFSGTMIVVFGLVLIILSLSFFRRRVFEIFLKFHWVLFILIALACVAHEAWRCGVGLFFTGLDCLIRAFVIVGKPTRVQSMTILPGNVVRITFNKQSFTYEAGQYIFVCIPAIALTEWHPFSFSSAPADDKIMVHIRVLGDWTEKLYRFVEVYKGNSWSDLTVLTEGPYGKMTVPLQSYSSLVLVSGGIGITPMQSIFNQCLREMQDQKETQTLKRIHFVWSVRDPSMVGEFGKRHWAARGVHVRGAAAADDGTSANSKQEQSDAQSSESALPEWFSPNLIIVDAGETSIGDCKIITHFYLTRVKNEEEQQQYLQQFPFLKFGRPDIAQILADAKRECPGCSCSRSHSGVAALTCGPDALIYDVARLSSAHGIDCHSETFVF